jgi:hypothetical protein
MDGPANRAGNKEDCGVGACGVYLVFTGAATDCTRQVSTVYDVNQNARFQNKLHLNHVYVTYSCFLVRMRSPVRIWIAAPTKALETSVSSAFSLFFITF